MISKLSSYFARNVDIIIYMSSLVLTLIVGINIGMLIIMLHHTT